MAELALEFHTFSSPIIYSLHVLMPPPPYTHTHPSMHKHTHAHPYIYVPVL